METDKAAVIVLNHGDNDNALRLVSSLTRIPEVGCVCLVDNTGAGGLTGREEPLCHPKAAFLRTGNFGYARCNNAGLRYVEEKYGPFRFYAISNTDVEVPPESFAACAAFLSVHAEYAVAAPHMFRPDGRPHHLTGWKERTLLCDVAYSSGLLSRLLGMYRETYPAAHWQAPFSPVDCVAGSFFLIDGAVFRRMGFFDTHTFLYYEEDILGYRLKREGYRLAVLNTCRYVHTENVTVGRSMNLVKKYWIMQRSRLYFHKHYKKENAAGYAVLCAATGLGLVEKTLKTGYYRLRAAREKVE